MYFESISHVKMENGNNCILPIRKPLLHILRQLLFYLDTGLLCRHMYILKQQEIILALRGVYTKSELADFFSRTTGVGRKFEDFVLDNYKLSLIHIYRLECRTLGRTLEFGYRLLQSSDI